MIRSGLIAMVLAVQATTAEAEIVRQEYFARFPFWESPIQAFKGQNPLTQAEAEQRVHVQASYDERDRLVDVQTRIGGTFKDQGPFFRGLYYHAEHTKIAHDGNREIHRFYNRFGARITGWGDVWETVYLKDDRGRYIRMEFFDPSGRPVENAWGALYYSWDHQLDGSVIEERWSKNGDLLPHRPGFEFRRIRLSFGPDGTLSLMQNIDETGALVHAPSGAAQYKYYYNAQGGFDRWEVMNANGEPALGPTGTAGEQYQHGDHAFSEIAFFDREGQRSLHASGAAYWRGQYDTYGNITALTFTGLDDEPLLGRLGFHETRYEWSADGKYLMAQCYVGVQGEPINSTDGLSCVRYERDERGLLLSERFFDAAGEPAFNTYRDAAFFTYEYDDRGVLKQTSAYDLEAKPVDNLHAD